MTKRHLSSLGPYDELHPRTCVDCGVPLGAASDAADAACPDAAWVYLSDALAGALRRLHRVEAQLAELRRLPKTDD